MAHEIEHEDIVTVSNILNDTKAYTKIGLALGIEIDSNSEIFEEIETFIVDKFQEMQGEIEEEMGWFEVHDDITNKTLIIKAKDLEQAIGISDTLSYEDYNHGDEIDVIDDIGNYVD